MPAKYRVGRQGRWYGAKLCVAGKAISISMYCEFFGFSEKPFTITPNPDFIYLSSTHREAFAHLLYGIDNHAGFIAMTGEVGTGKTTVLRTLLSQLDHGKISQRPDLQSLRLR